MGKRLEDLTLVDQPPAAASSPALPARPTAAAATFPTESRQTASVLLPKSVADLLPSSGFIREYLEFAFPLTEASAESHLAAALVTASALIAKNVSMAWAATILYLNLWVALLGPSTLARKTTALRLSEGIVREVEASRILPDDTSAAALIDQLAQGADRVWYLSEYGLLLEQCEAKYNVGLKQLLANLYDTPPLLSSARRGRKEHSQVLYVPRPYLVIFGATTTAWITPHLTEADVVGGLYGRFLYFTIPDQGPHGRRISIPPAIDETRYQRVLDQARQLYAVRGTLDPTRIHARYDRWYRQHGKELYALDDRDRLGSFWGRLETYTLKLAALHQLSLLAGRDDGLPAASDDAVIMIEPDALDLAIALVDGFLKPGLIRLFRQELATSKVEKALQKVLTLVQQAGGTIPRRDLQRRSSLLGDDFNRVMRSLLEDGRLKQEQIKTPKNQTRDIVLLGDDEEDASPRVERGTTDA